ncbi:M23 family metallopeptidase [Kineosporia rhizophila]|uniref:M23 family metallopeptidase n=1 Tax=Kineosporia rhizophila TaxID=84633 RepID=UPI001E5DFB4D|nr:M23 family metallopeptidase [Kineosporia rhizophila]
MTIVLELPFTGSWLVQNSPAERVPSHGTDRLGSRYAIDFVAVDERHRSASRRTWRTLLASEPPELFHAFGRPVLAPIAGRVVRAHDGEPDHEARRSQLTLIPYALGQARRLAQGPAAVAGNHLIVEITPTGPYLALVHLRRGSLRVAEGERIGVHQHLADCGNSGNSTQPHLHLQVSDRLDLGTALGVPILFRRFTETRRPGTTAQVRHNALPTERAVIGPAG